MLGKTVKCIISISILITLFLTLPVHADQVADQADVQSELDAVAADAEMETGADISVEVGTESETESIAEPVTESVAEPETGSVAELKTEPYEELEPELETEPEEFYPEELYVDPEEELYTEPETEFVVETEPEPEADQDASQSAYDLRMDYLQDLIQQDAYNIRMEAFEELSNNQFTIVTPENFWTVYDTIPEITKEELAWLGMETYGVDFKWMGMLIGTTVREGYFYDPYLYYAWACAMLNVYRWYPADAVYWLMSGWGGVTCEACGAYYSEHAVVYGCNYHVSYITAPPEILKCIYMALMYRDERIFEVDGMIGNGNPSRLIYNSPVYNCQVWSW